MGRLAVLFHGLRIPRILFLSVCKLIEELHHGPAKNGVPIERPVIGQVIEYYVPPEPLSELVPFTVSAK
jgi:hypothetical protein